MASSSYVVKVQYEGAIRRLTLQPAGKEPMFSYAELQSRTRDLFQVPPTAQLHLTYIDNDGDVVTMADDQDLQDAFIMQSLNPLRMHMVVIDGNSDDKKNSPVTQEKTKSDADVERMSTAGGEPAAKNIPAPAVPKEKKSDGGDIAPSPNSSDVAPGNSVDSKVSSAEKSATDDKVRNPEVAANAVAGEDGSKRDIHHGIRCDGCGVIPIAGPRFKSCKKANYDLCLRCFEGCGAGQNEYVKIDQRFYRLAHPAFFGRMMRLSPAVAARNGNPGQDLHSTSVSAADTNKDKAASASAKEEEKKGSDTNKDKAASAPAKEEAKKGSDTNKDKAASAPAKEEEKKGSGVDPKPIVHCGVQCDECGVIPVEGPRFKSRTRFNYDLCLACFEKSGSNAKEYSRLDQPVANRGYNYPPVMGTMIGRMVVPNHRLGFRTRC